MRRLQPVPVLSALALVVTASMVGRSAVAGYHDTYLAVGDSLAFGETDFLHNPSSGADRGYVAPFAQQLAGSNGGVAPTAIDLGVDGETSTTFLNGGPVGNGPQPGMPAYGLNTNYDGQPNNQNALMLQTIQGLHAGGHQVGMVTVQLGANDLFELALSPGFLAQPAADQASAIGKVFATFEANMAAIVTELKAAAPEASIVLMGYYDPFAPFRSDPSSPFFPIAQASGLAIPGLNAEIHGLAGALGVRSVDLYTPFVGHELAYTYVADPTNPGNIHPNALGYAAIAGQLRAVPEPSSVAMLALGAVALVGAGCRRGRRKASA